MRSTENRIRSQQGYKLRNSWVQGRPGVHNRSSSLEWAAQQGLWRLGAERAY
jgi:hypothetical protein